MASLSIIGGWSDQSDVKPPEEAKSGEGHGDQNRALEHG
jgi:hypothetical protein